MAKYKKGERIRIGMSGSSEMHEGKLVKMGITEFGNLKVEIEKDNGLPAVIFGLKHTIVIERVG
jgi:hypothetical protein